MNHVFRGSMETSIVTMRFHGRKNVLDDLSEGQLEGRSFTSTERQHVYSRSN